MVNEESNKPKNIFHDIQIGTKENPLWRHWGYSVELDRFAHRPSDACDFCKDQSGTFYKTTCHCGSAGGRQVSNMNLGINNSFSPENGDYHFYSCERCVDKLTTLVQEQEQKLPNHECLVKVINELKNNYNEK
ncbi:MAG: hypothetical protein HYX39_11570 [Bacteroidetes bacterium]|nr:hypothetical protein [Bacteroidota bacterium]